MGTFELLLSGTATVSFSCELSAVTGPGCVCADLEYRHVAGDEQLTGPFPSFIGSCDLPVLDEGISSPLSGSSECMATKSWDSLSPETKERFSKETGIGGCSSSTS